MAVRRRQTAPRRRDRAAAASSSSASRTSRPGSPIVLDRQGLGEAERGDLAVVRTGRGRARVERVLGQRRPDRERARGAARRAGRPRRRSSRTTPPEPSARRPRRPARAAHVHDRPRDGEGLRRRALVPPRGRRDPRLGAHRRRLVLRAGRARRSTAAPPSARFSTYVPGLVAPMLPHELADDLLQPAPAPGPAHASRSRSPPERRAALLPLGDPQRRAAHLRPGGAILRRERAEPEIAEELELARAARAELRRRRFARGALRIETPEIELRVRRPRRRRAGLVGERAARAHARRGADDPRQRGASPSSSPAAGARRSTACTSGPTRSRSRCSSPSSPTSTCRRRPCPSTLTPADGGRARRRDRASASPSTSTQSGRGREAFPVARPARAQAGALRPARTSATPGSRAPRTATSPRRSAATPTSSSTARSCASSASPTTRRRTTSASSPSTARRASARRRRSSTSPTTICLAWLLEARAVRARLGGAVGGRDHRRDRLGPLRPLRRRVRGRSCPRAGCPATTSS